MKISGRLIDAFLALEETRHFGLAAQRCHVSPSALSQSISRLEAQLGIKLFDRDTRNVFLTPEGEIFSLGANRIAAEIRTTLDDISDRLQKKRDESAWRRLLPSLQIGCLSGWLLLSQGFLVLNSGCRTSFRIGAWI